MTGENNTGIEVGIYGPSTGSSKSKTFSDDSFRYMAIAPRQTSRLIRHPVEDGTVRFDNKVVDPFSVTVVGIVYSSDTKTRDKIEEYVRRREWGFFTIVGFNGKSYENAELVSASHRESADEPDAQEYTLEFQQVMVVKAEERPPTSIPDDQPTKTT